MTIQLKCPNGHRLTAHESNAGKSGKCPVCKAAVVIPIPVRDETAMTDSAVVRILGLPETLQKPSTSAAKAAPATPTKSSNSPDPAHSSHYMAQPNMKHCPSCDREIELGYHICPYCRTYITGLNDF